MIRAGCVNAGRTDRGVGARLSRYTPRSRTLWVRRFSLDGDQHMIVSRIEMGTKEGRVAIKDNMDTLVFDVWVPNS